MRGTCVKSIKSLKGRVGVTEELSFMSTFVLSYSIAGLIIKVYLSAVVLSVIGFVGRLSLHSYELQGLTCRLMAGEARAGG